MRKKNLTTFERELSKEKRRETYKRCSKATVVGYLGNGLCRACGSTREDNSVQHCQACREKRRSNRLTSQYGITLEEYNKLGAHQNFLCWICKKEETSKGGNLHVDHDHKTGKVRGLLCFRCNSGIGGFGESVELLKRAIEYLEEHKD